MKLSRICSKFSYGKWEIHQLGYVDGAFVSNMEEMKDWFYFKKDQQGLLDRFSRLSYPESSVRRSLFGDKVIKVEYSSIKEKNTIEGAYPEYVYESDIPPEFRYVLKNNLEWAEAKDRHILYFDIETWCTEEDRSTPDRPRAQITCIAAYSTKLKKFVIFSWHPIHTEEVKEPQLIETDDTIFVMCQNEIDMIVSFLYFVNDYNVDIISGWYSSGFDVPYILNRCRVLNIDTSVLSPVGEVKCYRKGEFWKTYIVGLDHIDMMDAIKDLGYNLTNYKLATAAKEILKEPNLEKLTEVTFRDWEENFTGFLEYAKRDVEILKEIDEARGIFDLFCQIQRLTNIPQLGEVLHKSAVVDKYILSECRGEFIFPTRVTKSKQSYMGAIVLDPTEPGVHEDVAVFDFASLYPTSVMSFNLSPETYITSEEELLDIGVTSDDIINRLNDQGIKYVDTQHNEELFGKRYFFFSHQHKVGILPRILKKLYYERKKIKKRMRSLDDSSEEYSRLDKHQDAMKLILNSSYGAMGFPYFRLYTPEVADAITYFARQALLFAVDRLETDGYRVLYGDTDSCFARKGDRTNDQVNTWVDRFNESLSERFIPMYNNGGDESYYTLELEFEKDMERIYFGNAKKRYYGIIRDTGKKYIRGMNIIRKDAPSFIKGALDELAELAVKGNLTLDHFLDLRKKVESVPFEELGVVKNFGRRFDQFKNVPQHLKASLWANELLGCGITHQDSPYMFYVVSHCEEELKPRERHSVICLKEEDLHHLTEHPELFTLDYDTFYDKQVIKQLEEFKYIESVDEAIKAYKKEIKK